VLAGQRHLLAVAGLAALLASAPACKAGECGEGTIEEGGVCVPATSGTTPGECCGEGTHYDPTLQACVSDYPPTVCDEGSPTPVVHEDGVLECCGCALFTLCQIICPDARPGTVSVCGSLRDMETGERVEREGCMSADTCDPDDPESHGSCALELRFYDALDLAQNGAGATSLGWDTIEYNACGAYAVRAVPMPASGFLALVVDDSSAHEPAQDDFTAVAAVFAVTAEARVEGQIAHALRRTTDQAWTAAAGDPFGGDTFSEHGAQLARFIRDGVPVQGVAVTDDVGAPLGSAYYFAGADAEAFAAIDPAQGATGVNGAALLAPDAAVTAEAAGGLPAECAWPGQVVEPVAGVLLVEDRVAEVEATGEPCN